MSKEIIIDENRSFEGIWIPKKLYVTNKFNPRTKFFLVELKSLSKCGYCYASDKHFANFLGISERMVQNIIKSLKDEGYLETEYEYEENKKSIKRRFLILTDKFYDEFYNESKNSSPEEEDSPNEKNFNEGIEKKFERGTEKKFREKYNNKDKYNNKNKNINNNNRATSSLDMDFDVEILRKASSITSNATLLDGINYYLKKYRRAFNRSHPDVTVSALEVIIENITDVLEDVFYEVIDTDGITRMIDRHFKTDYGQDIDYNIVHFGTEKILEYQARNVGLITGWRD